MREWEVYSSVFGIQWHITPRCDKNCLHCYVRDPETYKKELENELSQEDLVKICDRIEEFKNKYNANVSVSITGGNPILRKEYRNIVKRLKKEKIPITILGNVYKLDEEVDFLKYNIKEYQLSLDGTKEFNDKVRGPGSWEETMRGIDILKSNNIEVGIMYTVSKDNMNYIKEVYDICSEKQVNRFSFDRVVPLGNAKDMVLPSASDYKNFLYNIYLHTVSKGGSILALKDQLFKPLLNEMGLFKPKQTNKIINGCLVGVSGLSILADGTVYPCRRLPIEIGKLPEQSIEEIFFDSPELNELREYESIAGCGECDLLPYCRGNRCVAYAQKKDYFSEDPQCWRCKE